MSTSVAATSADLFDWFTLVYLLMIYLENWTGRGLVPGSIGQSGYDNNGYHKK